MSEYLDQYGLVRMNKDIPVENGILFRSYLDFFKMLNGKKPEEQLIPIAHTFVANRDNWFQANPPEEGQHFSRDNMWGLYFMLIMSGCIPGIKNMPVFKWNDEIWWHPNGWAVFLSLKYLPFKILFFPLVWGMYKYSVWDNQDPDEASGACLWTLMVYFLYGIEPGLWETGKFKQYITYNHRWDNFDNPIYLEVREYETNRLY